MHWPPFKHGWVAQTFSLMGVSRRAKISEMNSRRAINTEELTAFASAGFSAPEEGLGADDFISFAVIAADDVFLSLTERKDGVWALASASNVYKPNSSTIMIDVKREPCDPTGFRQWECCGEWLNHWWEASFSAECRSTTKNEFVLIVRASSLMFTQSCCWRVGFRWVEQRMN